MPIAVTVSNLLAGLPTLPTRRERKRLDRIRRIIDACGIVPASDMGRPPPRASRRGRASTPAKAKSRA